jgi:hypothetical protein
LRGQISIVQVRASDVQSGDIVNRRGPDRTGWIEVTDLETLPNGDLVVHDEDGTDSFTAQALDVLWLQVLTPLKYNSHLVMPD